MSGPSAVEAWGSTSAERAAAYGCDGTIERPDAVLFRAVDVHAPADVTFRWLCQLRVAPYSYDWIDNFGRRSPCQLVPGLEQLETGQTWCRIFRLVAFQPGRSITLDSQTALFGRVGITYVAAPAAAERSRIVAKVVLATPRNLVGRVQRVALPYGDLVMMRKQLLTLRAYAEDTYALRV